MAQKTLERRVFLEYYLWNGERDVGARKIIKMREPLPLTTGKISELEHLWHILTHEATKLGWKMKLNWDWITDEDRARYKSGHIVGCRGVYQNVGTSIVIPFFGYKDYGVGVDYTNPAYIKDQEFELPFGELPKRYKSAFKENPKCLLFKYEYPITLITSRGIKYMSRPQWEP